MVSSQSLVNLEVCQHLKHVASKPRKARPLTAVNPHRKDHLHEMWQGLHYGSEAAKSTYGLRFANTPAMAEELRGKDYTHHFKWDGVKEYTECLFRHKITMRKFEVIKKK